jgi:ankyrin repeat protein
VHMAKTALDPTKEYRAAIEAGSAKGIRALMQRGVKAHPLAILGALLRKQFALIPLLKEAGADPDARDAFGRTALGQAVNWRSKSEVKIVLEAGADPNKEELTLLPLVLAAGNGFPESVSLLLQYGADVNKAQWNGLTALTESVRYGHRECVELLVKAGADPWHKGPDGNDSFELARKTERNDILAILDTARRSEVKVCSKPDSGLNAKPPKRKRRASAG